MHNNPHVHGSIESKTERCDDSYARWIAVGAVLLAVLFTLLFAGCGSFRLSSIGDAKGLPIAAIIELHGPDGTTPVWGLYDGDVLIAQNGDFTGLVSLVDKTSGVTIAQAEFTAPGQILVQSHRRDFKQRFSVGDSLPAFVAENYPPLLLERYGIIVEGSTPAASALRRQRPAAGPATNIQVKPHGGS